MAFVGVCRWFMWFLSPLSQVTDISNGSFHVFFFNFDMDQLKKSFDTTEKSALKLVKIDKFESGTS